MSDITDHYHRCVITRPVPLTRYDRVMLALAGVDLVVGIVLAITISFGLGGMIIVGFLMLWTISDHIRTSR